MLIPGGKKEAATHLPRCPRARLSRHLPSELAGNWAVAVNRESTINWVARYQIGSERAVGTIYQDGGPNVVAGHHFLSAEIDLTNIRPLIPDQMPLVHVTASAGDWECRLLSGRTPRRKGIEPGTWSPPR